MAFARYPAPPEGIAHSAVLSPNLFVTFVILMAPGNVRLSIRHRDPRVPLPIPNDAMIAARILISSASSALLDASIVL